MSTASPQAQAQKSAARATADRMDANCKIIWGDDGYGYDIDSETDDYIQYYMVIKKETGDRYDPLHPIWITPLYHGDDKAWKALDKELGECAGNIRRVKAAEATEKEKKEGKVAAKFGSVPTGGHADASS